VALDGPGPAPTTAPVEKPQIVTPELQASLATLYSWITKTVQRPLVHLSALGLLFCMTALYLAAHSRGVSAHRSIQGKVNSSALATALHPDAASRSTPVPAAATPSADGLLPPDAVPAGDKSPDSVISYIVQPHDTVVELCQSIFGRYDEVTLSEIRKLNPRLKDPDHLEIGQEIRLPRTPQKTVASKTFLP
jgi:hypothetical protein